MPHSATTVPAAQYKQNRTTVFQTQMLLQKKLETWILHLQAACRPWRRIATSSHWPMSAAFPPDSQQGSAGKLQPIFISENWKETIFGKILFLVEFKVLCSSEVQTEITEEEEEEEELPTHFWTVPLSYRVFSQSIMMSQWRWPRKCRPFIVLSSKLFRWISIRILYLPIQFRNWWNFLEAFLTLDPNRDDDSYGQRLFQVSLSQTIHLPVGLRVNRSEGAGHNEGGGKWIILRSSSSRLD